MIRTAASCLAELTTDVILCMFLFRALEQLMGAAELHEITGAVVFRSIDIEKSSVIGHALCLLKIVRDDSNREPRLQFEHQFLDLAGGDWVKSRAWLIHQ